LARATGRRSGGRDRSPSCRGGAPCCAA
jgi:hypothetical protein